MPVLVDSAIVRAPEELPAAIEGFARRQAHELSDTRWDYDLDQLVAVIARSGSRRVGTGWATARRAWKVAAAAGGAALVIWGVMLLPGQLGFVRTETPDPRADTVVLSAPDPG